MPESEGVSGYEDKEQGSKRARSLAELEDLIDRVFGESASFTFRPYFAREAHYTQPTYSPWELPLSKEKREKERSRRRFILEKILLTRKFIAMLNSIVASGTVSIPNFKDRKFSFHNDGSVTVEVGTPIDIRALAYRIVAKEVVEKYGGEHIDDDYTRGIAKTDPLKAAIINMVEKEWLYPPEDDPGSDDWTQEDEFTRMVAEKINELMGLDDGALQKLSDAHPA